MRRGDAAAASEEERNPLTAPEGRDGEWDKGLSVGAPNRAAGRVSLEEKLRKYRYAVIGLAACACCLVIIVVAGAGAAAATHGRRHRHRAEDARLSLAMLQLQSQMQAQASAQRGGTEIVSVAAHHQDDLCPVALGFDQAKADACTREGGVCVADMADCAGSESGGVIKGTCGPSCGCCFAGCPAKWIGDGECDFACNTEENGWDGRDCRGAAPMFSECPSAWKGDGECDDLCNNAANQFDGGDCKTAQAGVVAAASSACAPSPLAVVTPTHPPPPSPRPPARSA